MNTKVTYLYRDANNYKMWNQCIVKGNLSEEQKERILNSLNEGEFFIPRKVGLPEGRFDKWDSADHIWFEINEDSFILTEEEPTVLLSVNDLVKSFTLNKGKWENDISYSIEEAKASVDKHQWTITDPDCLQVRRLADYGNQNIFELVQIDTIDLYDKNVYKIAHGDINLSEYTDEEKDSFLKMYGHSDINELTGLLGSELEAKGQLAEMIFETYIIDYYVEVHINWNDAVNRIEEYTEIDLSEYKQEIDIGLMGTAQKVSLNERLKLAEQDSFNKRVDRSKASDLSL